ncbi:hypothetical protein R1sor_019445 [Riccia sorocarpa]|uniref:Uncharacterized protein n=1 Tax=Riccia sorocarpa TaxID=122646 RepID=A0ABD3ICJ4_9MARC
MILPFNILQFHCETMGVDCDNNGGKDDLKVQGAKKIPTYEDIFINKSHEKNELAENWPRAHAALLEGHQKIRCLFNNPDPQFAPLMHDILHSNFRTKPKPEMRAKLSEFVDKHIDKLPVLEFNDDEVGQTVIIKWKPLELYKQMLSFLYDYRKGKRSRTSSNSAKLLQEKHKKADKKSGQQTMEDVEEKLDGKANSPVAIDQNISNKSQRSFLGDEHDRVSCKSQRSFLGDEHDGISCNVLNTNDTRTKVDNSDEEFFSLLSKPRSIDSTPSKGHRASHFTDEVDDMSPAHFLCLRKTVQLQQSRQQQHEPETNSSPLSPTPIRNRVQRDVDKLGNNLDDRKASSPHKANTSTPMTRASKRKLVDGKVQTRTVDTDEGHNQQEVILDEIKVTVTELTLEARRVIGLMVLSCEFVTGIAARINQYMAGENSKSSNKPFKNYLRKSIADEIDFVVSHALQTKQVKLKGKAQLREGKITSIV